MYLLSHFQLFCCGCRRLNKFLKNHSSGSSYARQHLLGFYDNCFLSRFLRGTCKVTDCPFSHRIAPHKMPTCRYFLQGVCNRDDCPYRHVNVAVDADICVDFARGYCSLADLVSYPFLFQFLLLYAVIFCSSCELYSCC